jgi:DNA-directed RNA polymerase subunit H (RpoH/RPB5)
MTTKHEQDEQRKHQQSFITSIYNSRHNILEIMEYNGYNTDKFKKFDINEIYASSNNKNLDMILETNKDINPVRKIYIRYFIENILTPQIISSLVEELFETSDTLNKETDTLFIIINYIHNTSHNTIPESIKQCIKQIWHFKKILVVVEDMKRLQFNILKHILVPQHIILTSEEVEELNKEYSYEKLSTISRFDPVSIARCLKPGQVFKILRPSETAIIAIHYRKCVEE